jgi:hypothetical protein
MMEKMQIAVVGKENGADDSDFVSSDGDSEDDIDEENEIEEDPNKIS